jgi:TRAP-type C4-dicarboxylate transport system permease small subunit
MRLLRWLHRLEDTIIVVLLFAMIALGVWQILLRNFFDASLVWIDPLTRHAVLWIGLFGAMIASRNDQHIRIDLISHYVPARLRRWLVLVVDLFTCSICVLVAWYSAGFVIEEMEYGGTAFAGLPSWLAQAVIPFGFAVIGFRYALLSILGLLGRRPAPLEATPS